MPAAAYCQALFNPQDHAELNNTSYAFYAKYIDGKEVLSINKGLRLTPASIQKLFTAAAAVETLGADKKFETRIYHDGKINFLGTLNGNIYILGGGDPSLGSHRMNGSGNLDTLMTSWAAQLKEKGIRKVKGNIYADSSLFEGLNLPPKVVWEDMGNAFGATSDALSIHENSFRIYFKNNSTEVSRITPQVEGIKLHNNVKITTRDDNASVTAFSAPKQFDIYLDGERNVEDKNFSINVSLPNPPLFAAQKLKEYLQKQKISVTGRAAEAPAQYYGDKTLLITHYSPPLSEIISLLNKKSINIYSEILLKHLALASGLKGSTKNAVTALGSFLENNGIPTDNFQVHDGSGLTRYNFITAETEVKLLELMAQSRGFEAFYSSMVNLSDYEKTPGAMYHTALKAVPAEAALHYKTGSLTGVRSYAGYINDYNGKKIAFTFIVNNYTCKAKDINTAFDDILVKLSSLGKPKPKPRKTKKSAPVSSRKK